LPRVGGGNRLPGSAHCPSCVRAGPTPSAFAAAKREAGRSFPTERCSRGERDQARCRHGLPSRWYAWALAMT